MAEFNAAEFNKDLEIGVDLDEAFRNQASIFSYYAQLSADASKAADDRKMMCDIVEARVSKQKRQEFAENKARATEAIIHEEVMVDKSYVSARIAYTEAKAKAELLKSCLEALRQRRDCLVQLGVAAREESKGDLRMSAVRDAALKVS